VWLSLQPGRGKAAPRWRARQGAATARCQRRACPRALRVLLAAALLCTLGRGAGARCLQQADQAFYPGAAPLDQATQAQARLPLFHAWLHRRFSSAGHASVCSLWRASCCLD